MVRDITEGLANAERREAFGKDYIGLLRLVFAVPVYVKALSAAQCVLVIDICHKECLEWMNARSTGLHQCRQMLGSIWSSTVISQPTLLCNGIDHFKDLLHMYVREKTQGGRGARIQEIQSTFGS